MKHVFNIILKLKNPTWKKTTKLFLVGKNGAQISGFEVAKQAPSPWKKIFQTKNSSTLFARIWSSKRYAVISFK